MPEPIDLHHLGAERVIGSYLLETEEGPALLDCGPATCIASLEQGLHEHGLELGDVRSLLLTHIHLDHAGAAGVLVRRNPELQVHVSDVGAPHLVDPARLERSARRLYGESFDTLWGELAPIPAENVHVARDRVSGLDCFPTPGHASHHVCYLDAGGTLYAGDAAGVQIQPHRFVMPPTPPPDFDLEAWDRSLDELERREPERLALIHFGVTEDPTTHVSELRARLHRWAEWVEAGADSEQFAESIRAELAAAGEGDLDIYERAMPFWQSHAGLKRYWERHGSETATS